MLGLFEKSPRLPRTHIVRMGNGDVGGVKTLLVAASSCLILSIATGEAGQMLQLEGGEVSVMGEVVGQQVHPDLALSNGRGLIVFEDTHVDGDGSGIGGVVVGSGLTGAYGAFRVNSTTAGDQKHPQVAILKNGGEVIVWQSRENGKDIVRARFLGPDATFLGNDFIVSSPASSGAVRPRVASLAQGGAVIVWGSFGQDDAGNFSKSLAGLQGVFGRIFDDYGTPLGPEFQINQSVAYNQRDPQVTATSNGGFAVAWVSEGAPEMGAGNGAQELESDGTVAPRTPVEIFVRTFTSAGSGSGAERKVNHGVGITANPAIASFQDGGLFIAWSQNDGQNVDQSWDVFGRTLKTDGTFAGAAFKLNTFTYGDQYQPQLAPVGSQLLSVWTSLRQDGSFEGVFGQVITATSKLGDEFQINSTTASKQMHPAVASQGLGGVSVVWTSYGGGLGGFDLKGKSYFEGIPAAPTPHVNALSQSRLSVTWPEVAALEVDAYLLYVNDNPNPQEVGELFAQVGGLAPGSVHSFRLAYRLQDGRISPLSGVASGRTLGEDGNFDGLPDEWQQQYFGADSSKWPSALKDSDGDGASNLEEFWAGTSPSDSTSVLRQELVRTDVGLKLRWNTIGGFVYQVETSSDLSEWTAAGKMRFSHGNLDEISVNLGGQPTYYRIHRLR